MKKTKNILLLFSVMLLGAFSSWGQSIQNGSFEAGTVPNGFSQVHRADFWEFGCAGTANLFACNATTSFPGPNPILTPVGCVSPRSNGSPNCRFGSITTRTNDPNAGEFPMNIISGSFSAGVTYSIQLYAAREVPHPVQTLPTYYRLEAVLRKSGDCVNELVIPMNTDIPGNCSWVQLTESFTLTPAQAAFGYDRIEFREQYQPGYSQIQIFIDDVSLLNCYADIEPGVEAGLTTVRSKYGPLEVYKMCERNLIFDGSGSNDESAYILELTQWNAMSWSSVGTSYSTGWVTGTVPSNLNLESIFPTATFTPGVLYQVKLSVGPVWNSDFAYFVITGSEADAHFTGTAGTIYNHPTPYGPLNIPLVCGNVEIDGSGSRCEDRYYLNVEPFNPLTWSTTGPSLYSGWTITEAPSDIEFTAAPYNLSFVDGQFYLITFAVGLNWDVVHLVFKYEAGPCSIGGPKRVAGEESASSEVRIFPNPANSVVNFESDEEIFEVVILDLMGKEVVRTNQTSQVAIDHLPSGVYIVTMETESGQVSDKFIKK